MKIWISILGFVLLVPSSATAYSYCSEPSVPYRSSKPQKPVKPELPYCARPYSLSKCTDWEVRAYNNNVENYNRELAEYANKKEEYIKKLKQYLEDAEEYAVCELKSLDQNSGFPY
ncbi:hypothetical protein [Asticcacaulis sp.]|uniref:hypothetical protein n=1 Tax=Asticcacaulis sp. TaxID=1872648 RepID=UPI00262AAB52|nr:hypothetical protein [Asticcacaulis sp.]